MSTSDNCHSLANKPVIADENSLVSRELTDQQSIPVTNNTNMEVKARDDLELIGAQVFFRHGARTPVFFLPGLEEVIYTREHVESYAPTKWDIKLITKRGDEVVSRDKINSASDHIGDRIRYLKSDTGDKVVVGQLTAVGEKQLFELGQLLKKELIDSDNGNGLISEEYDPRSVYCRSTFMDRTIASARSFLAGLFFSETSKNKVQETVSLEIEVRHFPDEDLFPNPSIYGLNSKYSDAESFYASLNDEHELKKVRQKLIDHIGVADCKHGIMQLNDEIVSRQAHGFSVPDDLLELTKDFNVMSAQEFNVIATNSGVDIFVRSTFGKNLHMIKENFDSMIKNYLEEKESDHKVPYHKLFVYSGHDTTLIPLAMALDIFDMQWPRYASYILMKYYVSKKNSSETFITVNYAGIPQKMSNCDDYYCPYTTFLKNIENHIQTPQPGDTKI